MDISWDDAQTFLSVAEASSFSAAGRRLGLGQPTISRRIAALEARLGCQLFRRGKRGAELTDEGARLLPAAREMARWAAELSRLASGSEERPAGRVRIAAPPGLAVGLLAPLAALARERLPEIRLEVLSSIEHIDLTRGGADLALRTREPAEPELAVLASARVELGIFAAAAYAEGLPAGCGPADLDWITWAFPYEHLQPRPILERWVPDFEPAFASDDYLVQRAAAESGLGAMVLERGGHPLAASSELVELDVGVSLPPGAFHLVCAKSMRFVPRVRAVAELVVEEVYGALQG